MYSDTYLMIRGFVRTVTMAVIVGVPVGIVFAVEGWTQTW